MVKELRFEYEYQYKDSADGIMLPVRLSHNGRIVNTTAKVDPGATVCLVSREDGLDLDTSVVWELVLLRCLLGEIARDIDPLMSTPIRAV
jgi:hypothetical protein